MSELHRATCHAGKKTRCLQRSTADSPGSDGALSTWHAVIHNGRAGADACDAGVSGSGRTLDGEADCQQRLPFSARNAMLLRAIPTFCARPATPR